jgi:hypothetical protein
MVLVAVSLATPATALDVPLPDLVGGYEYDPTVAPDPGYPPSRAVDFRLPDEVVVIDALRVVLSGEWYGGEITCDDGSGPVTTPLEAPLALVITSDAFPGDRVTAFVAAMPEGPFTDLTLEFESCCPPGVVGFDQLVGVDLHAELRIDLAIVGLCWVTVDTWGVLDDVHLELTGTVGAPAATWSGIKGLYR